MDLVIISFLFLGFSEIFDISISPYAANSIVRGIGVAVINKMSQLFPAFSFNKILWCTPNLCCSSMTTKPMFSKVTFCWNNACVPIIMSASKLWLFLFEDVISEHVRFKSLINSLIVLKCCSARISVGAIKTDLLLFSMHCIIANNATMVFPLPTSPCRSLNILLEPSWSFEISSIVVSWSPVSWNFNWSLNCFDNLFFLGSEIPFLWLILFLINLIVNCWENSSSKTSRSIYLLSSFSFTSFGLCIW